MKEDFITVKQAQLNNHCPECYSTDGLILTFSQKFKETVFYKALTNYSRVTLDCNVCQTQIFPVSWTDDIERVVAYHKKAFVPKEATFKLKKLSWAIIILLDLIILLVLLVTFNVIEL